MVVLKYLVAFFLGGFMYEPVFMTVTVMVLLAVAMALTLLLDRIISNRG